MIEGRATRLRDIPRRRFACIAADPGTRFEVFSETSRNGRLPQAKYRTMALRDIARTPVREFAARDCFLFFWTTTALAAIGAHVEIMRAWGFEPTALAFSWAKTNPGADPEQLHHVASFHFGTGYTTRKNTELCFLGRRGSPVRLARDVRELIVAPRREHSRKPEEFFERVERYCAGPRLELFSRRARPGWLVWGDQVGRF